MLECAPRIPEQPTSYYPGLFYPQNTSNYPMKCAPPSPKDIHQQQPQQISNSSCNIESPTATSPTTDTHYQYPPTNPYYSDCLRSYPQNIGLFQNTPVKQPIHNMQYNNHPQVMSPPVSIQQSPTASSSASNSPNPHMADRSPAANHVHPFYWPQPNPPQYMKPEYMLHQNLIHNAGKISPFYLSIYL